MGSPGCETGGAGTVTRVLTISRSKLLAVTAAVGLLGAGVVVPAQAAGVTPAVVDSILIEMQGSTYQPTSFPDAVTWFQEAEIARNSALDELESETTKLAANRAQLVLNSDYKDFTLRSRDEVQEDTNALAAATFMNGISSEMTVIVDTVSGINPLDSVLAQRAVTGVSGGQALDLDEANQLLAVAEELVQQNKVDEAISQARVTILENELVQAQAGLDIAQAYLAELVKPAPVSGPQTVVNSEGCPTEAPVGTVRVGHDVFDLCKESVEQAATPSAALAIIEAFSNLGTPYACGGVGRLDKGIFDCSSLVTRAYSDGAGLGVASEGYAPSTRSMMPWDGYGLSSWFSYVSPQDTRPGDLVLQRTCTEKPCTSQHVVMLLARGTQLHTNACGDVAHIKYFDGFESENFVVSRRVLPATGEGSASVSDFSVTPAAPVTS